MTHGTSAQWQEDEIERAKALELKALIATAFADPVLSVLDFKDLRIELEREYRNRRFAGWPVVVSSGE